MRDVFDEQQSPQVTDTTINSLPVDVYFAIMGNALNLTLGTPGLRLKDVRVWIGQRTPHEINIWRYRQVDPRFTGPNATLGAYYRLD